MRPSARLFCVGNLSEVAGRAKPGKGVKKRVKPAVGTASVLASRPWRTGGGPTGRREAMPLRAITRSLSSPNAREGRHALESFEQRALAEFRHRAEFRRPGAGRSRQSQTANTFATAAERPTHRGLHILAADRRELLPLVHSRRPSLRRDSAGPAKRENLALPASDRWPLFYCRPATFPPCPSTLMHVSRRCALKRPCHVGMRGSQVRSRLACLSWQATSLFPSRGRPSPAVVGIRPWVLPGIASP